MEAEKYSEGESMLIVDFDDTNYQEWYADSIESANKCMNEKTATWININCSCKSTLIDDLTEYFGFSGIVSTNLSDNNSCTQLMVYPEYTYLSFFNLNFNLENFTLSKDRICSILGKEIILTFQENSGSLFFPIREKIKSSTGIVRRMKIDYLQYLLLNTVVENMHKQFEDVKHLTAQLEKGIEEKNNEQIFQLKKMLIDSREHVLPLVNALSNMNRASGLIASRMMIYYDDLLAKAQRNFRTLESQIEQLNNIQLYRCSSINQ